MRRGIKIFPLVIVAVVILFQWLGSDKVTNPETGKKHRVAMSSKQEEALGLQSYKEVLAKEDVITSGPEVEQVVKVAKRLAPATGTAAKDFDWQVSVIRSDQANAFCLPGGKIAIYTGILKHTQSEAGLAAVMGHEMAHAVARHGSQRLFRHSIAQTAMAGAAMSLGDMDPGQRGTIMALLGAGAQYGVLLPFSREHETEADEMGLLYMARAGYDPREAIEFWKRMGQAGGAKQPEFMSTHPGNESRIQRLQEFMPKAIAEYEKAKR